MDSLYIRRIIKKADVGKQLEDHASQIDQFKAIIDSKSIDDVKNSLSILDQGNSIFFDKNRTFSSYDEQSIITRAQQRMASLSQQLNCKRIKTYCDIGCGRGENLIASLNMGVSRAVGIDIEPDWNKIDWIKDKRIQFKQLDISKVSYEDSFDLVTSYWAFEHFDDPYTMLNRMAALVAKGGYLYIRFGPLWNSNDGHHLYRHIQFPYYHLIFNESIKTEYFNRLKLSNKTWCNKWSAYDFMMMFLKFNGLKMVDFSAYYNTSALWFINSFPSFLENYSMEELLTEGFKVVFKNV